MIHDEQIAVLKACKEQSLAGTITFPDVIRQLSDLGVERCHIDISRGETTYYWPTGESYVLVTHGPDVPIATPFSAAGVEGAVRASQRGEITYPEFLRRIMAAGCVGYFTQIIGRQVQYIGRTGDMHVEPFPNAKT